MKFYLIVFSLLIIIITIPLNIVDNNSINCNEEHDHALANADILTSTAQADILDELTNQLAPTYTTYHYDNFMQSYFANLTTNIGYNYKGSCGYVALGMLLSYYDTYLNDDIIPEQYDVISSGNANNVVSRRNSPGILRDEIVGAYNYTASQYLIALQNMSSISLHAKLITIANTFGYYDLNDDRFSASTTFMSRYNVLNNYLINIANIDDLYYNLDYIQYGGPNSIQSNDVRNYIIDKIEDGYPVLISIAGIRGGHVAVAYDYDSNTDSIYTNMGWFSHYTHVTPESENYSIYKSAMVINWNLSHEHTNNYRIISNGQNQDYCFDSNLIEYRNHAEAIYTYQEIINNYNYHIVSCVCGWTNIETHCDFIIGFPNPSVTCGKCYKWLM